MATTLTSPKGISSNSVINVPDQWSAEWFRTFIRTQLSLVDIRNATPGAGISISGQATSVATLSVSPAVSSLFHQPYALAAAAVGTALDDYRVIAGQAGVLTVTDGGPTGNLTLAIAAHGISAAQFRQSVANSVVGNPTAGTANVADISSTVDGQLLRQAAGALGFGTVKIADTSGLGPSFTTSGLTTGQVLRASGAAAAAFAQLSFSDLAGQTTLAQLPTLGAQTVLGNVTVGSTTPTALSETQLTSMILTFSASLSGAVPASGGGTAAFLRADGNFAVPAYPTGANPTASVGLAAVNGTAVTFMRSDGAPALSQAIVPTWSAQHIFASVFGTAGVNGNAAVMLKSAVPVVSWVNTAAAVDAKTWELLALNTDWNLRTTNDAGTAAHNILDFTRSGLTVTGMAYGNSTDNPPHTFNGALILAGQSTTTTAPAAGGAGALPATPKGYLSSTINGVAVKFAFY